MTGRLASAVAAAAAALVLLGGCASHPAASRPAPPASPPSTSASGSTPLTLLDQRCGPLPRPVYQLGGAQAVGNATPLRVQAGVGARFVVWASYARRHLSGLSVTPAGLQVLCHVDQPGPGGGPAAVLQGPQRGSFTVGTRTDDCGPCAGLAFRADVTVEPVARP
ncbi:MAG TPA: hypothetical protein VFN68_17640 [Acidimicrobiales bacterium]|nr:hypothetical protein [Acidimicrobiales bacterium]